MGKMHVMITCPSGSVIAAGRAGRLSGGLVEAVEDHISGGSHLGLNEAMAIEFCSTAFDEALVCVVKAEHVTVSASASASASILGALHVTVFHCDSPAF
jgi:hypothetical protein